MMTLFSISDLLFSFVTVVHLARPSAGDTGGLGDTTAWPYPNSARSPLLGLLNPKGFSQVLSTDLFALDLFHDATGEPAPFAIMKSFSQHPAYNTKVAKKHNVEKIAPVWKTFFSCFRSTTNHRLFSLTGSKHPPFQWRVHQAPERSKTEYTAPAESLIYSIYHRVEVQISTSAPRGLHSVIASHDIALHLFGGCW